jgi:hypothetical protein
MQFPKIMILASGGTHGDFLYHCCELMLSGSDFRINEKGQTVSSSFYKNQYFYYNGKRIPVDYKNNSNDVPYVELSHVWYDDFISWSSQFYFINYDDSLIPVIRDMFIKKACNSNVEIALETYRERWKDDVAKKFHKENFDEVFTVMCKRDKKLFKRQPGIIPIEMVKLYDYSSLVDILKNMGVFNSNHKNKLHELHSEWKLKNLDNIAQIQSILT